MGWRTRASTGVVHVNTTRGESGGNWYTGHYHPCSPINSQVIYFIVVKVFHVEEPAYKKARYGNDVHCILHNCDMHHTCNYYAISWYNFKVESHSLHEPT